MEIRELDEGRAALQRHVTALLEARGVSPETVAEKIGVAPNTIYNMIKATKDTRVSYVSSVAAYFGLQAWQLLQPQVDSGLQALQAAYNKATPEGKRMLLAAATALQAPEGKKGEST